MPTPNTKRSATPQDVPMRAEELDYELPEQLIATKPAEPRDTARLFVVQRTPGGDWTWAHRTVRELPEYLQAGDLMVCNVSRVLPARLLGVRTGSGGKVEGLFLEEIEPGTWRVMLRSNGRLRPGDTIHIQAQDGSTAVMLNLAHRVQDHWQVQVTPPHSAEALLDRAGRTPLPPYIVKARDGQHPDESIDRSWYQTVYARQDAHGSIAAPTAGLHFTQSLLESIRQQGVQRVEVVLHVGAGTFKPVTAATLEEHVMHEERFTVPASTIEAIQSCRANRPPGRILAVGTTTVRTLESAADQIITPDTDAELSPIEGRTKLLIAPGHRFALVDMLLTNFHLPRSTLLALIAAMLGRDVWRACYAEAIRERYRFFSYGDAMLIMP